MNIQTTFRSAAVAATVAALLTASPAAADLPLSGASASCRAAIAKSYSKLVNTGLKTIAACHKARDKDPALEPTNCNALTLAGADSQGKFSGAMTKLNDAIAGSCAGQDDVLLQDQVPATGGGRQFYISCPVTCAGVPDPIDTMANVGVCLGCIATETAEGIGTTTLGLPPAGLSAEEQKCRGAIAKGYNKYLGTALKLQTSCQNGREKDGITSGVSPLEACSDLDAIDTKSKVSGAKSKAEAGLDKACAAPIFATSGGCANDTLANLKICTASAFEAAEAEAFRTAYEMPSTGCPRAIRTTIRGGCSVNALETGGCSNGFETGTQLSVGWKSAGHGVDITDSYTLAGDVTCPGSSKGTCGDCTVDNVSLDNPQYEALTRCVSDTSKKCTNAFGTDPACPGDCRYYLGPPLAVSASGTPTCTMNIIHSQITGTANPDTGESELNVNLRAKVHTGLSQLQPCPICINDETPQDDQRDGTCKGGLHDGDPCDVQGFDLSFAPTDVANPTAGNSLDCPLLLGANISGTGLAISLPLTTGAQSKPAEDPCESPNASLNCFCGVCSLAPTVSCNKDTDCSGGGMGVCGKGSGVDRFPNECTGLTCSPVNGSTDRGVCVDTDKYCSGLLFTNGKGVLTCSLDADCDSYISMTPEDESTWVCPGNDCGTCSVLADRKCFLDPIATQGTPDTVNPILVGTFCLPPSDSGAVNSTTGTPGPGLVKTDAVVELRY